MSPDFIKTYHLVDGYSINGDDMHWNVSCPVCDKEFEFTGYFDSDDITKCRCGCEFKITKVYFYDGSFMK